MVCLWWVGVGRCAVCQSNHNSREEEVILESISFSLFRYNRNREKEKRSKGRLERQIGFFKDQTTPCVSSDKSGFEFLNGVGSGRHRVV